MKQQLFLQNKQNRAKSPQQRRILITLRRIGCVPLIKQSTQKLICIWNVPVRFAKPWALIYFICENHRKRIFRRRARNRFLRRRRRHFNSFVNRRKAPERKYERTLKFLWALYAIFPLMSIFQEEHGKEKFLRDDDIPWKVNRRFRKRTVIVFNAQKLLSCVLAPLN